MVLRALGVKAETEMQIKPCLSHRVFVAWHSYTYRKAVCVCVRVYKGVSVHLCAHSCLCNLYHQLHTWISQVKILLRSLKLNQTKLRDSLCIQNHLLPASSSHEPPKMQKEPYQCL